MKELGFHASFPISKSAWSGWCGCNAGDDDTEDDLSENDDAGVKKETGRNHGDGIWVVGGNHQGRSFWGTYHGR